MELKDSKYYKLLKPNIDEHDLIIQSDGDAGDTLHREGFIAVLVRELYDQKKITLAEYLLWRQRYYKNLLQLKDPNKKGNYSRHVNKYRWFGRFDILSRDQSIPNMAAMGSMNLDDLAKDFHQGCKDRKFILFTNTHPNTDDDVPSKLPDIMGPMCWGLLLRNKNKRSAFFDLEILANSFLWMYKFKYKRHDADILNHWVTLIRAKRCKDTFIAKFARKLMYKHIGEVDRCFKAYFAPETKAANFYPIVKEILEESLK